MNGIVSALFGAVDRMTILFVVKAYDALNQKFGALFWTVVTIYIIWTGYKTFNGKHNALSFVWWALRLLAICIFVTEWNTFYSYCYKLAVGIPEDVGNALLSVGNELGFSNVSNVQSGLNQIYDIATEALSKIYKGGIFDVLAAIVAAIVMLAVYVMLAVCCAIILSGKIMIAITVALGPIFIAMAMFQYTRKYFDGWITAVVTPIVAMTLTYAFLGFYIVLFKKAASAVAIDPSNSTSLPDITETFAMIDYMPLLLISLIGFYILKEIVADSRTIAGGIAGPDGMARDLAGWIGGGAKAGARALGVNALGATGAGLGFLWGKATGRDGHENHGPSEASRAAFEKQLQPSFKGSGAGSSTSPETKT